MLTASLFNRNVWFFVFSIYSRNALAFCLSSGIHQGKKLCIRRRVFCGRQSQGADEAGPVFIWEPMARLNRSTWSCDKVEWGHKSLLYKINGVVLSKNI